MANFTGKTKQIALQSLPNIDGYAQYQTSHNILFTDDTVYRRPIELWYNNTFTPVPTFINVPNVYKPINYFVMRGLDVDCGTITYRTWTVPDHPDNTGALYTGPKCGASPLIDIILIGKYSE